MGSHTEVIFVEGNSTDQTWREIQRVKGAYPDWDIKILKQSARGKRNAVEEGFAQEAIALLAHRAGSSGLMICSYNRCQVPSLRTSASAWASRGASDSCLR